MAGSESGVRAQAMRCQDLRFPVMRRPQGRVKPGGDLTQIDVSKTIVLDTVWTNDCRARSKVGGIPAIQVGKEGGQDQEVERGRVECT